MRRDVFTRGIPLRLSMCYSLYAFVYLTIVGVTWLFTVDDEPNLVLIVSLVCVGILTVPAAFFVCRQLLLDLAENFSFFVEQNLQTDKNPQEWFQNRLSFFLGARDMYIWGLLLYSLAVLAYKFHNPIADSAVWMQAVTLVFVGLSGFIAGIGLGAVARSAGVFYSFGKQFEFRLEPHHLGVLSIGRTLLKCYFIIITVILPYMTSGVILYQNSSGGVKIDLLSLPIMIIGYPVVLFVLAGFVRSQYTIHQKMVSCKRKRLFKIDSVLRELEPILPSDLDPDRERKIRFFKEQRAEVLVLPEWPSSFSVVGGAAIVSLYGLLMPAIVSVAVQEGWNQLF